MKAPALSLAPSCATDVPRGGNVQVSGAGAVPRPFHPRLLPLEGRTTAVSLSEHRARFGLLPDVRPGTGGAARFLAALERSGLSGRGGAGFPTARKLKAIDGLGRPPVVVANGTEGEPASRKDKTLLRASPHLVLDGTVLVAAAVGAADAYVVVNPAVAAGVRAAAAERRSCDDQDVRLRVVVGEDRFVAGEASALANYLETGIAKPRRHPPRLVERGAWGRPTLVNNVETLAHVALIARYGPSWFRSAGTAEEPGSMLVTVLGAVRRPLVTEVELGLSVRDLLDQAGGPAGPLQALLVGGYFGSFVPAPAAMAMPYSRAGLAFLGASPGAGVIVAVGEDECGLGAAASISAYLADESAGQCGPCVFGLQAIAAEVRALADCRLPAGTGRLQRWLGQVEGRGACHLPDGAVHLMASAISTFASDVDAHVHGHCLVEGRLGWPRTGAA